MASKTCTQVFFVGRDGSRENSGNLLTRGSAGEVATKLEIGRILLSPRCMMPPRRHVLLNHSTLLSKCGL